MNELNEEIKLTINLMHADAYEGANNELQSHLAYLLEMKRNELQQRLVETDNPLTAEELKAGGWWCEDISAECANAFIAKGLPVFNCPEWGLSGTWKRCSLDCYGNASRGFLDDSNKKQIHRIGNEFYWSEK